MNFGELGSLNSWVATVGQFTNETKPLVSSRPYLHGLISHLSRSVAINSTIVVLPRAAKIFEDVQHSRHLTEHENARARLFELFQQFVKKDHFSYKPRSLSNNSVLFSLIVLPELVIR